MENENTIPITNCPKRVCKTHFDPQNNFSFLSPIKTRPNGGIGRLF